MRFIEGEGTLVMFTFHLKHQLNSKTERLKILLLFIILLFGLLMSDRIQDQKLHQMESVYTNMANYSEEIVKTYNDNEEPLDKGSEYFVKMNKEQLAGANAYLEGNYNEFMYHTGQGSRISLEARDDGYYFLGETEDMSLNQVYHLTNLHYHYMKDKVRLGLNSVEEAIGLTGLDQLMQFLSTYEANYYLLMFTVIFVLTFSMDSGIKKRSEDTLMAVIPKSSGKLLTQKIAAQLVYVSSLQFLFVFLYFIGISLKYGTGDFGRKIPIFSNNSFHYISIFNYIAIIVVFQILLNLMILLLIVLVNQLFRSSFLSIMILALFFSIEPFIRGNASENILLLPFKVLNYPELLNGVSQIVYQDEQLVWMSELIVFLIICLLLYFLNLIFVNFQDKKKVRA